MDGSTLTLILGTLTLASVLTMVRWSMTSNARSSTSAEEMVKLQSATLERMVEQAMDSVRQSAEIVRMQTALTEVVLLGRPQPPISQEPESENSSETSLTPDELFSRLPENIQSEMIREAEEAGVWPSPSARSQPVSTETAEWSSEEELSALVL